MIAALFVMADGCYANLDGVDPWPESRDARTYPGPHPVVAHPPCATWSRLAHCSKAGPENDGGCFAAALAAVRQWGGVIEYPMGSKAWRRFGLPRPGHGVGMPGASDRWGGYTIEIQQCRWGHRALKATWLYIVGTAMIPPIPNPKWHRCVAGVTRLSRRLRIATPPRFRDWLIELASSCRPGDRTEAV